MRCLALLLPLLVAAAPAPGPATALGPALAQVRTFAATAGNALWPGYGSAPFGFLMLQPEGEILLCNPVTPRGFTADGTDPATGCPQLRRARGGLPASLLAAMPLFGPPATIVMGTPETTGRSKGAWLRTIFHEHFHQWQWSLPDHYPRVAALDLAGGDTTGMWVLNFPFPYDDPKVGAAYADASNALADALEALRKPDLHAQRRELAYPYGAAEAMLMSACGRAWQKAYPTLLANTPMLALARRSCRPSHAS